MTKLWEFWAGFQLFQANKNIYDCGGTLLATKKKLPLDVMDMVVWHNGDRQFKVENRMVEHNSTMLIKIFLFPFHCL